MDITFSRKSAKNSLSSAKIIYLLVHFRWISLIFDKFSSNFKKNIDRFKMSYVIDKIYEQYNQIWESRGTVRNEIKNSIPIENYI